ncbi:transcription-repair coupling factor [Catelliglobosispora koreensis]|uniref:transcription-repair coupling factor n=1 Tax=Catelliglobosispora koreensis TaxID=129052 RepID=UPI000478008B|nr:transcription-repair coupling factor [Catelliglobosispora koreensis]
MLTGLLEAASADPALRRVHELAAAEAEVEVTAPAAARPFLVAAAAQQRPVLAVTATSREAEDLAVALSAFLDPEEVVVFPAWETLPHERLSPRSDTVGRRLAVLRRLAHPGKAPIRVITAPVRSLLQPQLKGLGDLDPVELRAGQSVELNAIVSRLIDIAYARVDLVTKRGEFAVRGGILDVFPPTDEHPSRVEFWGDEIEEIRTFSVADQRTIEKVESLWAPACRELLLTPDIRERAAELAADHPALEEMLTKLAEGIPVEGMESLGPALHRGKDSMELLIDCLAPGTLVLLSDPERIRTRAHDLLRTSDEFLEASWAAAATGGKAPIDLGAAAFKSLAGVREHALEIGLPWWTASPFGLAETVTADDAEPWLDKPSVDVSPDTAMVLSLNAVQAPVYHGQTASVVSDVQGWLNEGWRVVLVFEGHGPAQRASEVLRDAGIGASLVDSLAVAPSAGVFVTTGPLDHGMLVAPAKLAILTGTDISGGRGAGTREMGKMPARRRNTIDPLELRAGDFVVHEQHGIGKYVELVQRKVNGADREYLVIEYAASKRGHPGDRLFVPTDSLDQLSRYVGGEQPTLHKMGGSEWQKAKARARKAVREIAAQLIQLYAARQAAPGHAFGPDTPWQRELEDAFPYQETPDQLTAIDEVKEDMEKPVPMDRLICGDVGYGKTEIAVRAAFKAVQDGKQVAILVPTTLLAQQHFNTFSERFSQFPIVIRQLSRFATPKEATETIAMAADGRVDVVIGTHRLLQQSTRFNRLGLVIVDEEQRFGVEHKEKLKEMRANVDVLTMSATPIPRTLEMSITGIREMSQITTPPEERHPVLTYVGAYDDKQVAAAIHRELLRDGQVFYLHNRVDSIDKAARRIRELIPEARVGIAHGQMGEDALEKVMVGFWEKEYDVLVATTIIESGIDIPNANTLILERADLLGLAQLHQIRGRVGRGRERAYAYFLYPPEKPLTEHAHERLATIAQHTELGAGMYVAMKDLEIRGAGNLLGGEQSGHIEGVGFDLYVRMVGEAVAAFKGDGTAQEEAAEVKIDLPIDAHIPESYIESERLRLEIYRKLASARSEEALQEVIAEVTDRYGAPPAQVANLVSVAKLRLLVRHYGLTEISMQGKHIRFSPIELADSKQLRLKRYHPDSVYKTATSQVSVPVPMTRRVGGEPMRDQQLLDWCAQLLKDVLGAPAPVAV